MPVMTISIKVCIKEPLQDNSEKKKNKTKLKTEKVMLTLFANMIIHRKSKRT
jgi:hypothetical protein